MSAKPCVYISGPMTGYDHFNFPAFHDLANHLRSLGYPVVNPADFGVKEGETWADCLKRDLAILIHCDVVITLDGWRRSKGASLEVHVAKTLGIPVTSYAELTSGAYLKVPQ